VTAPAISVAPSGSTGTWAEQVLADAGIEAVPVGDDTEGLVWVGPHDAEALAAALRAAPRTRWVQLPSAGIEVYLEHGLLDPALAWTSAKGAFAAPVGEHALALTLALLRHLPDRVRATSWGTQSGTSLHGARAVVVGAGGVALETVRLLAAFGAETVVVRRRPDPAPGATRTVTHERLRDELAEADVVVLAAALTEGTRALLGEAEIAALPARAVVVNVGRGGLVDTDALVRALAEGRLAGAGLDVTDPEPLPDGHPLWTEPRALITPHTADTWDMVRPLLGERITENARRFRRGEDLVGVVDPVAGY
jgi:phosphoglycerate dehydrogenase-like enzyme